MPSRLGQTIDHEVFNIVYRLKEKPQSGRSASLYSAGASLTASSSAGRRSAQAARIASAGVTTM